MLTTRKPGLNPIVVFRKREELVFGKEQLFFHYGRGAIHYIFKYLEPGKDAVVLFPAYNCDTALQPLVDLGLRIRFYKLDSSLNVDMEDLSEKLAPDVKVLFIVHYFGFPQNIEQIRSFCNVNKLILVEDCSHVLPFSGNRNQGSAGDYSFYSLRKYFPVPGMGVLLINRSEKRGDPPRLTLPGRFLILKYLINDCIRFMQIKMNLSRSAGFRDSSARDDQKPPQHVENHRWAYNLGIHKVSRNLIERMDFEKTASIRRRNYNYLAEAFNGFREIKIIFKKLPPGTVPMGFPAYTEKACKLSRRASLLWPVLHPLVKESNEPACIQAREFASGILLLPLHEDLGKRRLDIISDTLKGELTA